MGLFHKNDKSITHTFPWTDLKEAKQWEEIKKTPGRSLIFKHSTRCGVSGFALKAFEKNWMEEKNVQMYYLDLLKNRALSDAIAADMSVRHESPQVLIIENGQVNYHASHNEIDAQHIKKQLTK